MKKFFRYALLQFRRAYRLKMQYEASEAYRWSLVCKD